MDLEHSFDRNLLTKISIETCQWPISSTSSCEAAMGQFRQIFTNFLSKQDEELFFGKCRLANGTLIWQISPHILGIFHQLSLRQNVGEIEWNFFLPRFVRRQLFAWQTRFGEIDQRWSQLMLFRHHLC